MRKLLEVDKLCKCIKNANELTVLINNLSFEICYGEAVAMICPSESRLTQLLGLLSGLNRQYEGLIRYHPDIENQLHYKILYTCNKDAIYEWRTVLDNTLLFLEVNSSEDVNKAELNQYVLETFEKYKLTKYKDKYPTSLSGSIKSKISLIKHMMLKPDLLILDDNFSNIDYKTKIELLQLLRKHFLNENNAILYATQNIDDVFLIADRILLLTPQPLSVKATVDLAGMGHERTPEQVKENPAYAELSDVLTNDLMND